MDVERRPHPESTGSAEGNDWWEYEFSLDGRSYSAERRLGSGATIRKADEAAATEDIESIADYLMTEDGVRFVYWGEEQIRPRRLSEPRPLRSDERALLDYLLSVDDPRFEPLRQQVPHVLVEDDSFLPFRLDLVVARGEAPPATDVWTQVPVEATSIRDDEWSLTARVWLDGDYLDAVEVDWYVNEPIRLPSPQELQSPQAQR